MIFGALKRWQTHIEALEVTSQNVAGEGGENGGEAGAATTAT